MNESHLANRGYVFSCLCNLVFCLSFHMLLPVLPLYLLSDLQTSESQMGIIMGAYPLAALLIRFVSGRIVDSFERKMVFVCCMLPFIGSIVGYVFFQTVFAFVLIRFIHGGAFGMTQTSVSTMAVDAIPPAKMGTGIGIFGSLNSLSMALGPMLGLFLQQNYSFTCVFVVSACIASAALLVGLLIKTKPLCDIIHLKKGRLEKTREKKKFSLDSFILKDALPIVGSFLLTAFPCGAMLGYLAIFAERHGITGHVGLFFTFYAAGLIASRFWSGKLLDGGHMFKVIPFGQGVIFAGFAVFVASYSLTTLLVSGVILGIGYGLVAPSYQMLIILLAPEEKRGTANSTYFLTWDLAIGLALVFGGTLADFFSLDSIFYISLGLIIVSTLWFVGPIRKKFAYAVAQNEA